MMTQLEKLKTRLEIEDTIKDTLLNQLLEDAEEAILDYCNRKELTNTMLGLQRELAIVYYNRLGDEGISSRSEGAISVSYNTEIPADILARLTTYRRLKLVGVANES